MLEKRSMCKVLIFSRGRSA
uniref:Uncharacterized protein n=1 Tax=Arundo donax TaxID=35708 RepID=A0A0A8YMV0_ARUDO